MTTIAKPATLPLVVENITAELKAAKHWCGWRWERFALTFVSAWVSLG